MEIGYEIRVKNLTKKAVLQVEIFEDPQTRESVRVETYWRDGTALITLTNDWEMAHLAEIIDGGLEYELETEDFADCKVLETHESQSVDISSGRFADLGQLHASDFECVREYYIFFSGVKRVT